MSHQTTMNGRLRRSEESPSSAVSHSLSELTHDLLTLGELQCQLLLVDLREMLSGSITPAVVVLGATLLVLGTVPVFLLGIGWLLVDAAELSNGSAFLIVSLASLAIAAGLGWWGLRQLKHTANIAERSQRELLENIRWIKTALLQQRRRNEHDRH